MFILYVGNDQKKPQAPVITSHPHDIEILKGHRGILEVEAYGTMPLYYQWYYEDEIIHGT